MYCTEVHIDDHFSDFTKYPIVDIPGRLEKDVPPLLKWDNRVMAAARYILLAGNVIDEVLVQEPMKESKSCGLEVILGN